MRNKCNTKMSKLTEIQTIRFSKEQIESLEKLKEYNVDVSRFIRIAIREKIQRDCKIIKENKEKIKLPF